MTDRDEIEMLAAEYALGTLDADERAVVDARRGLEPDLAAAIGDWERRLAPMLGEVTEEAPPPDLLARISRRIGTLSEAGALRAGGSAEIAELRGRIVVWRRAAFTAGLLAATLAGVVLYRDIVADQRPQNFVAVFQKDDVSPSFLMTIDLVTREVTIRPVAVQAERGKSYQLWIASEQLGPGPRSLGLLESVSAPTHRRLYEFDAKLLKTATFGISVEPAGGSPTGRPTGPALHSKLHPASP